MYVISHAVVSSSKILPELSLTSFNNELFIGFIRALSSKPDSAKTHHWPWPPVVYSCSLTHVRSFYSLTWRGECILVSMILQAWFPAQWDMVNYHRINSWDACYFCNVISTKIRGKYAAKFCIQYYNNKLSVIAFDVYSCEWKH